ncbi:MAG: cell division protein FtsZ [Paludibacteraceae bacterium]|nr:cell division protein FtsZ [Paludibacteraceae bacterium]
MLPIQIPTEINKVIKVIGVGGGGGNAVNYMYNEGIHNVSFAICNADIQDLNSSPIPTRIQIGKVLTEGLGCGAKPEKGEAAAKESEEEIRDLLNDGTKMVFITAGMGGGTGTGAAPVIARIAKEMGILTIGIVTIPFKLEMGNRIKKAIAGVVEMKKYVDSLLVINNEKMISLYTDMTLDAAFYKANEVLSESAKSIAEMITMKGSIINIDFADVYTIMKDSGVAIMNTGMGDGEDRVKQAIDEALSTPLLKSKDIRSATRILMYVYTSEDHKITMKEMGEISEFVETINKDLDEEFIWGGTYDNNLESSIKITLIATGFDFTDMDDYEALYKEYYKESTPKEITPEEPKTEPATAVKEPEVIPFDNWANGLDVNDVSTKSTDEEFKDFDTPLSLRGK